jgi:hypothetical protein
MACVCAIILYFGLKRENTRREAQYGPTEISDRDFSTMRSENEGKVTRGKISSWEEDLKDPEYLERWGLSGMTKEEIIDLGDDHPEFRFVY